jgi:arsenite-transporting ATPase
VNLIDDAPRHLFFTGKGGVGKTSIACATAMALANRGRRVLLVSTDPASNLDEVLEVRLGSSPTAVPGVPSLEAMNLDPEVAAAEYRERMVGPYRGVLPEATVRSMEEQLSGSCTMEIAAFDEFSRLLGDRARTSTYDHVLFDTAPTGHTLRLLSLPQAWSSFIDTTSTGASCLGPLAGLKDQQVLYRATVTTLADGSQTMLVLVSRPEGSALREAERSSGELRALGVDNQVLVLNGLFQASTPDDAVANALEQRGRDALGGMPAALAALPRTEVRLRARPLLGPSQLRTLLLETDVAATEAPPPAEPAVTFPPLAALVDELAQAGRGVIMTMGKGGVGKTTIAAAIAVELARRGYPVHLTTTDPAAHLQWVVYEPIPGLQVSRIDAAAETEAYRAEVMTTVGASLDPQGRALLVEDLRSPCTEEVAVFRTFARTVAEGQQGFVVLDTAPTGHTILLLDAAEAYHREVLRQSSNMPDTVRQLLPRLRDPAYTRILLVTLPEATPVHEAARLQADLARAEIRPFGWVINQALTPVTTNDPVLRWRRHNERPNLDEVRTRLATRTAMVSWLPRTPSGVAGLSAVLDTTAAATPG